MIINEVILLNFYEAVLNYKENILKNLDELIRIPSISSDNNGKAEEALDYILNLAKTMGFKTKKIGSLAGHVEYGTGDELAAVLSHVDVVPCGDGWDFPPYQLTRQNGMLYGRGVADDKGASIVALYCLKVLKDNNIIGKRRIRLIFGAAEETGMSDMKLYFSNEEMPTLSFTPDSDYGICNIEKGILQLELSAKAENNIISEFISGSAINAVPDKAVLCINKNIDSFEYSNCRYNIETSNNKTIITFYGKASHACTPNKGINSASHIVCGIKKYLNDNENNPIIDFIDKYIKLELNGSSMGINFSDDVSGELTLNLGYVKINSTESKIGIDIRYPVKCNGNDILNKIKSLANKNGITVTVKSHLEPLYVEENRPIINILKKSYKNVTGQEAKLYSTGGGTYARTLGNNGVAFGPVFSGDDSRMHNSNECFNEDKFFLHAQICLEAMKNIICD